MTENLIRLEGIEETLRLENEALRAQLDEAEQTLNAIRQGTVDALVIAGPKGDNIFTLTGADHNYRLLIESIGEGALTATSDGSILYCNTKFAEMVEKRQETIVGTKVSTFVKESERVAFEVFLNQGTQPSGKLEVTLMTSKGSELSVQVSVGLLDADGLCGISIIMTDLTETKMAAELYKANKELERSNAELARFAFVASHDLKEPLRVVSNYVQMLELHFKGKLDENSRKYMKYITDSTSRMYALINDLLSYSRIGANVQSYSNTDTNQVVCEAISNIETSIKESGAEIRFENLPTVTADRVQLLQLFQNLLGNAIKYRNNEAPRILVESKRADSEWIFSVKDNGIGIDPQFYEKVFVLFQRLHGRDKYSGTGIGLAVCKKVVEGHGGKIWVESIPGMGSTFYFSLPDGVSQTRGTNAKY